MAKGLGKDKAVRAVMEKMSQYKYIYKTDVHSYYKSIDQSLLYENLRQEIKDPLLLRIISRALTPIVRNGHHYHWHTQGIPKGLSTSPFFAWFYLAGMDRDFASSMPQVYYQRFCDDILILTKTKHQLRHSIKKVRMIMNRKRLRTRREKTYIGKTTDPLCYLGYAILGPLIRPSQEAESRMSSKVNDMTQRGQSDEMIRRYLKRWQSAFPLASRRHAGLSYSDTTDHRFRSGRDFPFQSPQLNYF